MGDQPEDAPAVENPPPPVNPPIQPIQPVNSLPLLSKFEGANNPNQADMWPKWLRHFERYRIASGLQDKSNQEQVGTFLYAMRDCADDIVKTLSINETTASFDEVKTALNGYFAARRTTMLSLNEHGSIDEDKIPVNSWTPLFKTYTASPKIVSTELLRMNL